MGAAKLVVFANAVEDNPLLWRAPSMVLIEADVIINVGVSGPKIVVKRAGKVRGEGF